MKSLNFGVTTCVFATSTPQMAAFTSHFGGNELLFKFERAFRGVERESSALQTISNSLKWWLIVPFPLDVSDNYYRSVKPTEYHDNTYEPQLVIDPCAAFLVSGSFCFISSHTDSSQGDMDHSIDRI
jgi:hypothetical protein